MKSHEKKKELAKKIGNFRKDIKEEDKGEKHYEAMAKKYPKGAKMFRKMARQEEHHEENLERTTT